MSIHTLVFLINVCTKQFEFAKEFWKQTNFKLGRKLIFGQGIQYILLWHILRFRKRLFYFSNKSRDMKSNLVE